MKKFLLACLALITYQISFSQNLTVVAGSAAYDSLKLSGVLDLYNVTYPVPTGKKAETPIYSGTYKMGGGGSLNLLCGELVDANTLPNVGVGHIDDSPSSGLIPIPFDFCFYGQTQNGFYVNCNGNISFGAPYTTFTSNPFPDAAFSMIAPFWGDVDNRPNQGLIHYEVYSTYAVVRWQDVGYYPQQVDKLNNFQVVISDGIDPVIPGNNNVAFSYGDMQWTTGSASGGTNGFGGTPATVGANLGDGINYVQFGRFNQPNNSYDGPTGADDGIDWLDNKVLIFNVCPSGGGNIPPTFDSQSLVCDTIEVCYSNQPDTFPINVSFINVDPGTPQTVVTTVDTSNGSGFTITNNTSGTASYVQGYFLSSAGNAGYNTISFTATDDGTPPQSTQISITFNVSYIDEPDFLQLDTAICYPNTATVELVNNGDYTNYQWSNGSLFPDSVAEFTGGDHTLTVFNADGCSREVDFTVVEHGNYQLTQNIQDISCFNDSNGVISYTSSPQAELIYTWTSSLGDTIEMDTTLIGSGSINQLAAGTYYLHVVDTHSCSNFLDTIILIEPTQLMATTSSVSETCYDANGSAMVIPSGGTSPYDYSWQPVTGNQAQLTGLEAGFYYVTTTDDHNCSRIDTILVDSVITPVNIPQISGDSSYCYPGSTSIELVNNGTFVSYEWSNGSMSPDSIVELQGGTYTVSGIDANGCEEEISFTIYEWGNHILSQTIEDVSCFEFSDGSVGYVPGIEAELAYVWTDSEGDTIAFEQNPNGQSSIDELVAGTYYVTVTDTHNCVALTDTILIAEPDKLVTTSSSVDETCEDSNGMASVVADGGTWPYAYSWSPAPGTQSSINNIPAGTYYVTVTDANNCELTDTVEVTGILTPSANYTSDADTVLAETVISFTDLSNEQNDTIIDWSWDFGDGTVSSLQNPTHAYSDTGLYPVILIVTNTDGCMDTIIADIYVSPDIVVPNVFTPDGDNINDVFEIRLLNVLYPGSGLTIYNRWGKKIYESDSYNNDWDGESYRDGTYYYELRLSDGTTRKGNVLMIK